MMKRWIIFMSISSVLGSVETGLAQSSFTISTISTSPSIMYKHVSGNLPADPFFFTPSFTKSMYPDHAITPLLPSANYLPSLFCKMEYKIEGKSKLAPRFRLGSLNYTEWMEGKRELYNRYN